MGGDRSRGGDGTNSIAMCKSSGKVLSSSIKLSYNVICHNFVIGKNWYDEAVQHYKPPNIH